MKQENSKKIIASVFTVFVLGIILLAGPANAFSLNLDTDKSSLTQGDEITFTASLDIQAIDRYLPIQNLQLNIDGPTSNVCIFDINGNPISNCDGMKIKLLESSSQLPGYGYGYGYGYSYGYGYDFGYGYGYNFGYGYGYGYGYGAGGKAMHLIYEIALDTDNYSAGEYTSQLKAIIGDKTFESKDKPSFTINSQKKSSSSEETTEKFTSSEEKKNINKDDTNPEDSKEDKKNDFISLLTGAVTGLNDFIKTNPGIASLIGLGIMTILGGMTAFSIKKRRLRKAG